ncbi:MAG: CHAD domain-containing protein, partial [Candidatus Binatia bacterium]
QITRKRLDEILRARRWLLRRAVAALPAALEEAVIEGAGTASQDTLRRALRVRITEASEAWRGALAEADADRQLASIHALRIAGKQLRYRIEILHELGDKPLQSTLAWLRKGQDLLGDWHDRQTFYRLTAEVLGRPEVLLAEPDAVRVVVSDLETQRRKDFSALDEIFGLAKREVEQRVLDGWTAETAGTQS